jgi:hypothetical protein
MIQFFTPEARYSAMPVRAPPCLSHTDGETSLRGSSVHASVQNPPLAEADMYSATHQRSVPIDGSKNDGHHVSDLE